MPILKGVVSVNIALVDRYVVGFVEIVVVFIVISSTTTNNNNWPSLTKEEYDIL